jgi:hypothetical protein
MIVGTRWAAALLLAASVAGCGRSENEFPVVPVSGQMFYQSKPAEGALVILHPQGELASGTWAGGYPRGTVSGDGSFQISTYGENDGAPEGSYRVLVTWTKPASDAETGDPEAETSDLLRGRYGDPAVSPLEATVTAPSAQLPRFDLQ